MKAIIPFLMLGSIYACSSDEQAIEPQKFVYMVSSNKDETIVPVTVIDNQDGTGLVEGQLIYSNAISIFDAVIDDVDGNRHTMSLLERKLSNSNNPHSGVYWQDSISITIVNRVLGHQFVETFTGTR